VTDQQAEGRRQPADVRPQQAIELRIEELVLYGFSPADRLRIGAALEGELARLLAEGGLPEGLAGGTQVEAIDAGSFVRGPLATPVSIGGEVAQAVYKGMNR
jgi:hypothetical protein